MLGFIIFGTTTITMNRQTGAFFCPHCLTSQQYQEKGLRRFFTLYFIPLIPLDLVETWVECEKCGESFNTQVLELDEAAIQDARRGQFAEHCRRLMMLMMLADGRVEDAELETVKSQFMMLGGDPLSDREWQEDIQLALDADIDAIGYLEQIAPELTVDQGDRIVKSLFLVASATGNIEPVQTELMTQLYTVLGINEERYRQLIEAALMEEQ